MNRKLYIVIGGIAIIQLATLLLLLPSAVRANSERLRAGSPSLISYQGFLTDENGIPIDGQAHLQFSVYPKVDTPTNDYLWTEAHNPVQVDDGYFTVQLGQTTALDSSVFDDPERWLQVTIVDGSTYTYLPRQRIASAPYALQTTNADRLDGLDSSDFALTNHTHPAEVVMYTDSSQWPIVFQNSGMAVGTYTYPLTSYGIPSGVKAVLVEYLCQWPSSPGVCYLRLTNTGGTTLNVNYGDVVSTALVPVVNDTLYVRIDNATTETHLYILGYVK